MQPDTAAVTFLDPVEYVAELPSFGEVAQLRGQVLLKGLVVLLGFALKGSMDILWKVADQYVRHACIMLATVEAIKRKNQGPVNAESADRPAPTPQLTCWARSARARSSRPSKT